MYYISQHDVLCNLCQQVELSSLSNTLESVSRRAYKDKVRWLKKTAALRLKKTAAPSLKKTAAPRLKKTAALRLKKMKEKEHHQVNKAGFSPVKNSIICFPYGFLKEIKVLRGAVILLHKML
jgi:hypothetical protein